MNQSIKMWTVIWRNDPVNLALYGMKKPELIEEEWRETVGDKRDFSSCLLFRRRVDALNWISGNKDWEVVRCLVTYAAKPCSV